MQFSMDFAVLTINGYEISGFELVGDSVSFTGSDAGALTKGVGRNAVFVDSCDHSGRLVIKLIQHTEANRVLNELYNHQKTSLKTFAPLEVYYKDTKNDDEVVGHRGYFVTPPAITRGVQHNAVTWTIDLTELKFKLKDGRM